MKRAGWSATGDLRGETESLMWSRNAGGGKSSSITKKLESMWDKDIPEQLFA